MTPKRKAFTIWFILPYLFYTIVMPTILLLFRRDVTLAPLFRWKTQVSILATCAILASFGTIVLWLIPIRRVWFEIVVGVVLAVVGIALAASIEVVLFGGFEENVDIGVTLLFLSVPNCLAGALAGFMRPKEQKN